MSRRRLRREVSIPLWWFIAWLLAFFLSLLALLAMGLTLFGGEHAAEQTKFWISLAEEVIKAGAFGGIIAAVLHNRFEALFEEGTEASLKTHGIEELHLSREQAADDILAWIGDRGTTELWIAGISLRDFLPARGRLRNAWDAIWERLEDEKFRNLPDEKRLHVKLLLLDPRSAEGMFRYHVESETLDRGSLQEDVQNSIQQYKNVLDRIYALPSKYLELRLYEHGSFAFMVLTDEHALVEQYCYRDHTLAPAFQLIQYAKKSRSYAQVRYSLRVTWNHARELEHALHRVGTAKGVSSSSHRQHLQARRPRQAERARAELQPGSPFRLLLPPAQDVWTHPQVARQLSHLPLPVRHKPDGFQLELTCELPSLLSHGSPPRP